MANAAPRRTLASRLAGARWAWPGWWWAFGCVLVGLVLTVGVAWGTTLRMYAGTLKQRQPLQVVARAQELLDRITFTENKRLDPTAEWPVDVPADWPRPDLVMREASRGLRYTAASTTGYQSHTLQSGWPLLALRSDHALANYQHVYTSPWRRGIQYADPPFAPPRHLPIQPIWPAFAINTAFYAAIPWTLITLMRTARAHRRRKRGCCRACGYQLAGLTTCPECGRTATKGARPDA